MVAVEPGAAIGFLAILHTWGQTLHLHPHLHCVVPGGGISADGLRRIGCAKKSFFLPVRVLSKRFRNLYLRYLRPAFQAGRLKFTGEMAALAEPADFEALCRAARRANWVVLAKPPFRGADQVLKYLARYRHRVAISNHRLLSISDGGVSFKYKDYAGGNQIKVMNWRQQGSSSVSCCTLYPVGLCASASSVFSPTGRGGRDWRSAANY